MRLKKGGKEKMDKIEMLGIAASLLVICGFMCTDVKKIRLVNIFGAMLYVIYGFLISSYANIILNASLVLIHLYKLSKEKKSNG